MSLDAFDTRKMIAAVRQIKSPRTAIKDTFFGGTPVNHTTAEVDFDIIDSKRRMAAFVNPLHQGKLVEKEGYVTRQLKPAYVKPKWAITPAELQKRLAGDNIYDERTGDEKLNAMIGDLFADGERQITRREEWMAVQALTNGTLSITGDGVAITVNYGMKAGHLPALGAGARWSEGTSDPLADFKTWQRLITKDSGETPTDAFLGTTAQTNFLNNTAVKAAMDIRRINRGDIAPELRLQGVTYIGRIPECGLNLWGYEEWYVDDAGVEQPMLDPKKVIIGSSLSSNAFHYGAIMDLKAGMVPLPRFPSSWTQDDPSVRYLMLQSAPLPGFKQPDAFLTAQVEA